MRLIKLAFMALVLAYGYSPAHGADKYSITGTAKPLPTAAGTVNVEPERPPENRPTPGEDTEPQCHNQGSTSAQGNGPCVDDGSNDPYKDGVMMRH